MWREFDNSEDGAISRRHRNLATRPDRDQHGQRHLANPDHADGARHAASPSVTPPAHGGQTNGAAAGVQNWDQPHLLPPVYEAPPEPSGWWAALKMAFLIGLTIGGTLYGIYVLNAYLETQHREVPIYGDTAGPPPGRGSGPPTITWGGGASR